MRENIKLTDEQIEEKFNELGYGVDIDDLAIVRDTLDDFLEARKSYQEPGYFGADNNPGKGILHLEKVQPFKGQPRRTVIVIDFGAARIAYSG